MAKTSDKLIRGLWPLPGGNTRYLHTLDRILKWAASTSELTFDKAKAWLMSEYNVKENTSGSYLRVVIALGALETQREGKLVLTSFGRRILETEGKDKARIVVERFMRKYLAFPEVLAVYAQADGPVHLKEMVEALQPAFPRWTSDAQFECRALWLLSLGCLQQVRGRHYEITDLGRIIATQFPAAVEVPTPPLRPEVEQPSPIEPAPMAEEAPPLAEEEAEEIPDWLRELRPEPEVPPTTPAEAEAPPLVEEKAEEVPDWLRELGPGPEAPPITPAEAPPLVVEEEVEEEPDWLRILRGKGLEEPTLEEILTEEVVAEAEVPEAEVAPVTEADLAEVAPVEEEEIPERLKGLGPLPEPEGEAPAFGEVEEERRRAEKLRQVFQRISIIRRVPQGISRTIIRVLQEISRIIGRVLQGIAHIIRKVLQEISRIIRGRVFRRIFRIVVAMALFLIFLLSIIGSVILFAYSGVAVQKQVATSPSPSPTAIAYKTPMATSIATVAPTTAITGVTVSPASEASSVIVGGIIGIIGAVAGSLVSYWLESKREERRKRMDDTREVLEWAQKGRKESLRRADLYGADLRGVDLVEADLAFANLRRADLTEANLQLANLRGADLRGANLSRARLAGANLKGAKAWDANLTDCDLFSARNLPQRSKPSSRFRRLRQGLLSILVRYWRFWESHRLSGGNKDEVLDRLAQYEGLAAKVSPIWVLTMLLSNFLLVAVTVALIVSRGAWLMALVVIAGVVILNFLLSTWRSRCYGGSSEIRIMLLINTLIVAPVLAWIVYKNGWLMVIVVMAIVFVLDIPVLTWVLERKVSIGLYIVLISVPVGIDLAVGLIFLRSAWEAAVAVITGIFFLCNLRLIWRYSKVRDSADAVLDRLAEYSKWYGENVK